MGLYAQGQREQGREGEEKEEGKKEWEGAARFKKKKNEKGSTEKARL